MPRSVGKGQGGELLECGQPAGDDVAAGNAGALLPVGGLVGVRRIDLELHVIGGIDVSDDELAVVQAAQRGSRRCRC